MLSKLIDTEEVVDMPLENKVLKTGDRAPDFVLADPSTGGKVALADLLGKPLFINFGRGTW